MFGPDDVLPLDKVVFNTEAHAFPRFELGKNFFTGWKRKQRDADGNLIADAANPALEQKIVGKDDAEIHMGEMKVAKEVKEAE